VNRTAKILTNTVAAVGLGLWLVTGLELLTWYLKALGLAGAELGDLGIAIVELGEIPRSLALLLALTAVVWLASERFVRGEPVFQRLFPLVCAIAALTLTALATALHLAIAGHADGNELQLFGRVSWPQVVLASAAVNLAGAICALLARASDSRPWAVALAALPALVAIAFYLTVTRRIAELGVDVDGTATLPLIFPRPFTLAAALGLPLAAAVALVLLGRRAGIPRPTRSALLAAAPALYALHAAVCLGTVSPLMPLTGFAVDEQVRRLNDWATWGQAVLFGALWIALFAIQCRRYLARIETDEEVTR
jgi:hypothetical protein